MIILEYLMIGLRMFWVPVIAAVIGWVIAFGVKGWFSRKCRWKHNRKYVKIGHWTNHVCSNHPYMHTENDPLWAAVGTWVCQEPGCNTSGEKCFGNKAWWKIDHGQMVIDEKKMTDPGDYETPKQRADRKRKSESPDPMGKLVSQINDVKSSVDKLFQYSTLKVTAPSKDGPFTKEDIWKIYEDAVKVAKEFCAPFPTKPTDSCVKCGRTKLGWCGCE